MESDTPPPNSLCITVLPTIRQGPFSQPWRSMAPGQTGSDPSHSLTSGKTQAVGARVPPRAKQGATRSPPHPTPPPGV